jgi:hypothetical protein
MKGAAVLANVPSYENEASVRLPLHERREDAARPHRLVVRVEEIEPGIGDRRPAEHGDDGGSYRSARALAAHAAVASGAAAVGHAGIGEAAAVVDDDELHGDGGARGLAVARGGDLRDAAHRARRGEEAARETDGSDLAAIDGERRGHHDAARRDRLELQRGRGLAGGEGEDLIDGRDREGCGVRIGRAIGVAEDRWVAAGAAAGVRAVADITEVGVHRVGAARNDERDARQTKSEQSVEIPHQNQA